MPDPRSHAQSRRSPKRQGRIDRTLEPVSFLYATCSLIPIIIVFQSLSHAHPLRPHRTAVCQASLSFTTSQTLFKFIFTESAMLSSHLTLCHPLLLLPSIFPSTRVFSNELALHIRWPEHWSSSFSICPSNKYSGLT